MAHITKIVEELSTLTVMEAAELSKLLEEKWGVSSLPQVSAAPSSTSEAAPEKTDFDVILLHCGEKKIEVIKVVRAITSLGLKEAKDLVDAAPSSVKQAVSKAEANDVRSKLEAAGAKVEVK